MGHRALVAYERDDGLYDLHYSHWGADGFALVGDITAETPFGGGKPTAWARRVRERLAAGGGFEALRGYLDGDRPETAVDPRPLSTGLALEDVVAGFDFRQFEAFYVVSRDHEVTAYLPLWFGLDDVSQRARGYDPTHGALVEVGGIESEHPDVDFLRGWFRGTTEVLGDLFDAGLLSRRWTREYLVGAVTEWADEDRRVLVAPEERR